jgi:hypothetical protein
MAAVWVNFNNGDTGLAVRTKINLFNTAISSEMSTAETNIDSLDVAVAALESGASALDGRVTQNETDIGNLQAPASTKYVPQSSKPA